MSWRTVLLFLLPLLSSPSAVAQGARPPGRSALLLIPEDTAHDALRREPQFLLSAPRFAMK